MSNAIAGKAICKEILALSRQQPVMIMPEANQDSILPLAHSPFLACLLDESEELERALNREEGNQTAPDIQGHILEILRGRLRSDQQSIIDWISGKFQFSELDISCDNGLEDSWIILEEGHPCRLMQSRDPEIRYSARDAWNELIRSLFSLLSRSQCCVLARKNSPLNLLYEPIPNTAWQHFTITDWMLGVAETRHGERLYGIMIAFCDPDQAARWLNSSPGCAPDTQAPVDEALRDLELRLQQTMARAQNSPVVRRGIAFFYAHHPRISLERNLDEELMRNLRIFTANKSYSKPTAIRARKYYVELRNTNVEINNRNITSYNDILQHFLSNEV